MAHEATAVEFERRKRQWAASRKVKDPDAMPFPFDLQRVLELTSSSVMLGRFMNTLPKNATLVTGLQVMRDTGMDYRFFVRNTLLPSQPLPDTKGEALRHMVFGSPKARVMLKLV